MMLNNEKNLKLLHKSIFVFVFLSSHTYALKLGDECGIYPEIKRRMIKNSTEGCFYCDENEFWDIRKKRCETCTGDMTNLLPNILTSCGDQRPHVDVKFTSSTLPTTTSITMPSYDNGNTSARNTSTDGPEIKMQNATDQLVLVNVTLNNTEGNVIENSSVSVYGIPKTLTVTADYTTHEQKLKTSDNSIMVTVIIASVIIGILVGVIIFLVRRNRKLASASIDTKPTNSRQAEENTYFQEDPNGSHETSLMLSGEDGRITSNRTESYVTVPMGDSR